MAEVFHGSWEEEAALFARCRSGDERSRRLFFDRHQRRVYALALRLLGSVADAEDVVQESFLRVFRDGGGFRGESAPGTWLCRIALNEARGLLRRHKRSPFDAHADPGAASVARAAPSRDMAAASGLEGALRQLSEGYREVLVMHDVLGMDHGEIAAVLDVAVGTSKSQLHKARAKMRSLLDGSEAPVKGPET